MNPGMILGLFLLAVISGMLGLGVAFAAVPFLSLFLPDLLHRVQPLSLLQWGDGPFCRLRLRPKRLGGLAQSRPSGPGYHLLRSCGSPAGAAGGGAVCLVDPPGGGGLPGLQPLSPCFPEGASGKLPHGLDGPISVLSGFLGAGTGFLLRPTLILTGHDPKRAAAINAFAVTLPSPPSCPISPPPRWTLGSPFL